MDEGERYGQPPAGLAGDRYRAARPAGRRRVKSPDSLPARQSLSSPRRGGSPGGVLTCGSCSRAKGILRATHSAHSVSRLMLPLPDSSCDNVDLAIPARRATSARERPQLQQGKGRCARSRTKLLESNYFSLPRY